MLTIASFLLLLPVVAMLDASLSLIEDFSQILLHHIA
jgi:hypothetical protein